MCHVAKEIGNVTDKCVFYSFLHIRTSVTATQPSFSVKHLLWWDIFGSKFELHGSVVFKVHVFKVHFIFFIIFFLQHLQTVPLLMQVLMDSF